MLKEHWPTEIRDSVLILIQFMLNQSKRQIFFEILTILGFLNPLGEWKKKEKKEKKVQATRGSLDSGEKELRSETIPDRASSHAQENNKKETNQIKTAARNRLKREV